MPIYEYLTADPVQACETCATPFEVIRPAGAKPMADCPHCGRSVQRTVSRCLAVFAVTDPVGAATRKRIKEYEGRGQWSHAAELAEQQAKKFGDRSLREQALSDYQKAGYSASAIDRQAAS